ncbi:MAG TPA: hypothetical protein VFD33_02965 [Bacillota bacterium]|nr:hypothetical protein [Bacillota bacterium]
MDYLSDGDIHAISSIAIERPDIGIWASSTPTGRRGKFYQYCLEGQGGVVEVPPGVYQGEIYTVFYYPSTVLPTWNKNVEREWRLNLSEEAWEHEVMANFGQETVGVFNKEFIDRSKKDYNYIVDASYAATRVMGVDWDKQKIWRFLMHRKNNDHARKNNVNHFNCLLMDMKKP